MKTSNHPAKWWVDAALFAGFIIAFLLDLTGVGVHQWLGVAVGMLAGYHLLTHWSWVRTVTQRLTHTAWQARFYYTLDTSIFLGLTVILLSGLVISTWLGLSLDNYPVWREVHVDASIVTLGLVAYKVLVHWRWIVAVARRSIFRQDSVHGERRPVRPAPLQRTPAEAVRAQTISGRRDFLKLAGIVGAASLVSLVSAIDLPDSGVASSSGASLTASEAAGANSSQSSQAGSTISGSCTVRCNRGCSYPGHCGRYTDTNGNSRCDWGECL